jgi:hypothetical protein
MHEDFPHKEGDYVKYTVGDNMIGSGDIFRICEDDQVIIQTGNGARGLEYINKSRILKK